MGVGKKGKWGQKLQTSSYKMSKAWGCNAQRGDTVSNTIVRIESG